MCSYCSRFITTPTGIPTYRPLEKVHLLCCGLSADPNKSIHAGRPPTIDAARAVSCVPTNANKHFWPFLFGDDAFRSRLASLWVGWDEWVTHHSIPISIPTYTKNAITAHDGSLYKPGIVCCQPSPETDSISNCSMEAIILI